MLSMLIGLLLPMGTETGTAMPKAWQVAPPIKRPQPIRDMDVMRALKWDAAQSGPFIAPCTWHVATGYKLSDADRKLMKIGRLSVAAPKTIVTFNTHFTDPPNFYDGLPRDAKVLYLLTLLSDDQWQRIIGDGLSIGDCHGEQAAVMESIIPNPFQWNTVTALSSNSWTSNPTDPVGQLSEADRLQVKLRVFKHVELTLPIANNGGFTGGSPDSSLVKGKKMRELKEDGATEFGQRIKLKVDNRPQKSELDTTTSRFDVQVPLKDGERLAELVARVAAATGVELYPDPHYGFQQMVEFGAQASARDLLQGLALGVGGTYRRVRDAYVLTCDLEGVAAHKARLAAWEDDLAKVLDAKKDLLRSAIAKGGELSKVHFGPGAYEHLTQAELENLQHNDVADSNETYIDTTNASAAIRNVLENFQGGWQLDKQHVGVHSSVRYSFVMPDGDALMDIGWLDQTSRFSPKPWVWKPKKVDPVETPLSATGLRSIILAADSVKAAKSAVDTADRLGLKGLWLDASDTTVVKAAVDAAKLRNIGIRLVIRPWLAPSGTPDAGIDRTAPADHGPAFDAKKGAYTALTDFWLDLPGYPPLTRNQLSPMSATLPDRWAQLAKLAATPGLTGCVLLDAFPTGYEQDISFTSGSYFYSTAVQLFLSYGFSEDQRLAYLRKNHLDPLDIESVLPYTKISLTEAWSNTGSSGNEFSEWQKTKGIWARDAIQKLVDALPDTGAPILMTGQPIKANIPPYQQTYLYAWNRGEPLPKAPEDFMGETTEKLADVGVVKIEDIDAPEQALRVASVLAKAVSRRPDKVVVDFSDVPKKHLDDLIRQWLTK